jgi:hypothetical protein
MEKNYKSAMLISHIQGKDMTAFQFFSIIAQIGFG